MSLSKPLSSSGHNGSVIWLAACLLVLLGGCANGGLHHHGEHQFAVTGLFAHPFDETGRGDNAGATLGYAYYFHDRWAFLAEVTPYRNYNIPDGDAAASSWQIGVRWHFWEFEAGELPVGLYADLRAGMMYSSRSVPRDGENVNFIEDIGLGCELKLADNLSWMTGCRLSHLSHAHVFGGAPNPGQDDFVVYTGLGFSW